MRWGPSHFKPSPGSCNLQQGIPMLEWQRCTEAASGLCSRILECVAGVLLSGLVHTMYILAHDTNPTRTSDVSVPGFFWPLLPEAPCTMSRIPLTRCPQESVLSFPYVRFQLDLKLCDPSLPGDAGCPKGNLMVSQWPSYLLLCLLPAQAPSK